MELSQLTLVHRILSPIVESFNPSLIQKGEAAAHLDNGLLKVNVVVSAQKKTTIYESCLVKNSKEYETRQETIEFDARQIKPLNQFQFYLKDKYIGEKKLIDILGKEFTLRLKHESNLDIWLKPTGLPK